MDTGSQVSPKIWIEIESLNSLECFIEDVCDRNNVFHHYFANVLTSSIETFEIIKDLDFNFSPSFTSYTRSGKLIIVMLCGRHFLDVAALFQKDLGSLLQKSQLNFSERGRVNVSICSDEVWFNYNQQSIELVFHLSGINFSQAKFRKMLLEGYWETINALKSAKNNV